MAHKVTDPATIAKLNAMLAKAKANGQEAGNIAVPFVLAYEPTGNERVLFDGCPPFDVERARAQQAEQILDAPITSAEMFDAVYTVLAEVAIVDTPGGAEYDRVKSEWQAGEVTTLHEIAMSANLQSPAMGRAFAERAS